MKFQTMSKIATVIHGVCIAGLIVCVISSVILLGVFIFSLAGFSENPFSITEVNFEGMSIPLNGEPENGMGMFVALLGLIVAIMYLDVLRRLCSRIKRGYVFCDENFKYLKVMGILYIPLALLSAAISHFDAQLILQHANITGAVFEYSLLGNVSENLFYGLLNCGLTFIVAGALKMAIDYEKDSEGLV
ncbi:hypothetical protein [Motilimonas sp. KMU-193]|uniref:hypothetical protein n=1 Tax=Motilimonas sp. KMU-193 TaxID=3388668 RepID=UPI00396B3F85